MRGTFLFYGNEKKLYNVKCMNMLFFRHIKEKYIILFFVAAIIAVGTFGLRDRIYRSEQMENKIYDFEELMPVRCENGEWIVFPDRQDTAADERFLGKVRLVYDEKERAFLDSVNKTIYRTDASYSLIFFIDREIEVDGYKLPDGSVYAQRIRCVGAEADRNVQQNRRKLMDYINAQINSLALEKTRNGDWNVQAFYFVNDTDLYVQYETEASFMEEAPYDAHLWLIRVSGWSGDIPIIQTLAYIQADATDYEKNIVKRGEDIYKDVKNMTIYEYDEISGQWTLQ